MADQETRGPVRPGEPAPDFALPTITNPGMVALADYRGKSPLFLAINRGVWCPFCRRHIVQLAATAEKLRSIGVETLAVVASSVERARLYYRFRPAKVPLAADPELVTHGLYGVPRPEMTPAIIEEAKSIMVDAHGELPTPMPVLDVPVELNRRDSYELTPEDQHEMGNQVGARLQLTAQFLVDREGIVRWANIEGGADGLRGAGKFPTDDELLSAARQVGL